MLTILERKKVFNLLCGGSSSNFTKYLRIYESFPRGGEESLEVSCELVSGVKTHSSRLAIMCLHRNTVLKWVEKCDFKIPYVDRVLFENSKKLDFGIGLADYASPTGDCRIKIYNEYDSSQSEINKIKHIYELFKLFNISALPFRNDCQKLKKIKLSGIDWDPEGRISIKVYFCLFPTEMIGSWSETFWADEISCYNMLKSEEILPEMFEIGIKYSKEKRIPKIELKCQTQKIAPYLGMFDSQSKVSAFFLNLYRINPEWRLDFLSMQSDPVRKVQFYFSGIR